jgi:hypothetical protein
MKLRWHTRKLRHGGTFMMSAYLAQVDCSACGGFPCRKSTGTTTKTRRSPIQ